MSTVTFIQRSLGFAHRAFADGTNGTTEQLHFVPEHGSHSIAWCLWHTARVEDILINVRARQSDPIWDARWAERTRVPFEGNGNGMSDDDAQGLHLADIDAFREYQRAVWAQTDEYLNSLSEDDLERAIPTRDGGTETLGEGISLHMLGHFNGHRGEINTLRGMQGLPTVLQSEGTH